jgi:predicted nucleic acid-binding protein
MILPDINVLVHAYNSDSPRHVYAREWWEHTLNHPRPVGIPWACILGFIRIMTHRGILSNPMFVEDAVRRVRSWLAVPHVQIPYTRRIP